MRIRRQECLQWHLVVHNDHIGIVPEKPFQSLSWRLGQFLDENMQNPGMLRPQAFDNAATKDKVAVAETLVMVDVAEQPSLICLRYACNLVSRDSQKRAIVHMMF